MESTDINALFAQVQSASNEGKIEGAFEPLRAILQFDAGHPSAWFYVGELAVARGVAALAVRAYSCALAMNPEDATSRRMRAYALYWSERYDEALEDLEFLVRRRLLAPDSETVLRLRCDCYYGIERYAWALDDASEAVTHFPHEEGARKWRDEIMRRCLSSSEDADAYAAQIEALAAHARAGENGESTDDLPPLNPNLAGREEVELRGLMVLSLENAAREDETIGALEALTDRFENDAWACRVSGDIYWRRRNFDRARYWTERALAINPAYGAALFQMGQIEAELARRETSPATAMRATRLKLQAARQYNESALDWMQGEWDAHFGALGAVDFRAALPPDEDSVARPSAPDWDDIIEDFKGGDEYNA